MASEATPLVAKPVLSEADDHLRRLKAYQWYVIVWVRGVPNA